MERTLLSLLDALIVFLVETNLHAGLGGLSGKRDVYHGVVEKWAIGLSRQNQPGRCVTNFCHLRSYRL